MKREAIFARDGYRCVFCGEEFPAGELSVDHLQAISRGGDRSPGNIVTACRGCNARKGRLRLAEFLAADPVAHGNFRRLAVHAWKRHLNAIEAEAARSRSRTGSGNKTRPGTNPRSKSRSGDQRR